MTVAAAISLLLFLVTCLLAAPPTPDAIEQWTTVGILDQKLAEWQQTDNPPEIPVGMCLDLRSRLSLNPAADSVDTVRVLVILAEFTDWQACGQDTFAQPSDFQTLLFSRQGIDPAPNPTGSMTEFFLENSCGRMLILGDVVGWYLMPHTYDWYINDNDGYTGQTFVLAEDAVDAAEAAGVDFSRYANGDDFVDGVIVVHSGPGAETGQYGIWSNMSTMRKRHYDGVYIWHYTMNPEESEGHISTIGVFAHEWGHILGAPDMYNLDFDTPGSELGAWTLMSSGTWQGTPQGSRPTHLDAWCKSQTGLADIIWIDENSPDTEIPQAEHNSVIYGLKDDPSDPYSEYWLIENRQQVGFDQSLPGHGLLIYHVIPAARTQDGYDYWIAIEQADGLDQLSYSKQTDSGDPWPGDTGNRNFTEFTLPDAMTYHGAPTGIAVKNISDSDSLVTADLEITYSEPRIRFVDLTAPALLADPMPGGNGNGLPEAGERVEAYFQFANPWRTVYSPEVSLTADLAGLEFVESNVSLQQDSLGPASQSGNAEPIVFTIPPDCDTTLVQFTASLIADSLPQSDDRAYRSELTFQLMIAPQALPQTYRLHQNYPNPFNPSTSIAFTIEGLWRVAPPVHTSLTVFNALGQQVAILVNEPRGPGLHEVRWNAGDLAGGVYFYRLEAGSFSQTRKMILVK